MKLNSITMLLIAALMSAASAPRALAQHDHQGGWGGQHGDKMKGPGPHRGEWLRKHQNQPPQEQERALQNDPGFKQLPPQKQQELMQRLRRFNNLPPEQRQRILERMETFEHLPPPERQRIRSLYGQMRELPDDRRTQVRQAARQLSDMDPGQRESVLNSPQFQQRFSNHERDLIRGLADLQPHR